MAYIYLIYNAYNYSSRSKLVPTKAHVESDADLRQHVRYDV